MTNKQLEIAKINEEKVRARIDHYIKTGGKHTLYVEAPSINVIARRIYAQEITDKETPSILHSVLSKPSTYPAAMCAMELNRVLFSAEYQFESIMLNYEVLGMRDLWKSARYRENHPLRGIWRMFSWIRRSSEYFDRKFFNARNLAYEFLQEDRPLEQCSLKNIVAIRGFYRLITYNQDPAIIQKAPLDEFVAEQIRTIPEEMIYPKSGLIFKWVCGDRIVDMDCTLGELYGAEAGLRQPG